MGSLSYRSWLGCIAGDQPGNRGRQQQVGCGRRCCFGSGFRRRIGGWLGRGNGLLRGKLRGRGVIGKLRAAVKARGQHLTRRRDRNRCTGSWRGRQVDRLGISGQPRGRDRAVQRGLRTGRGRGRAGRMTVHLGHSNHGRIKRQVGLASRQRGGHAGRTVRATRKFRADGQGQISRTAGTARFRFRRRGGRCFRRGTGLSFSLSLCRRFAVSRRHSAALRSPRSRFRCALGQGDQQRQRRQRNGPQQRTFHKSAQKTRSHPSPPTFGRG